MARQALWMPAFRGHDRTVGRRPVVSADLQRERHALEALLAAADAAIARLMRPSRPSAASASATRRALGVAVGEAARIACAISPSSRCGRKRAGGDEGGGGRAADAGEAMDQQRLGRDPSRDEVEQRAHMRSAGSTCPGVSSTMSATRDVEVALGRDRRRPHDRRAGIEQRHQRARAGRSTVSPISASEQT